MANTLKVLTFAGHSRYFMSEVFDFRFHVCVWCVYMWVFCTCVHQQVWRPLVNVVVCLSQYLSIFLFILDLLIVSICMRHVGGEPQ